MCEVIQLLYSNECTRDQYPFNGQMRTGTGPALVIIMLDTFRSLEHSLEASFQVHRAPFFRPKFLTLRGHVTTLTTLTWQQKFIVDEGELVPLVTVHGHEHHKITKDSVRVLAREDSWLVKEKGERSHRNQNRTTGHES